MMTDVKIFVHAAALAAAYPHRSTETKSTTILAVIAGIRFEAHPAGGVAITAISRHKGVFIHDRKAIWDGLKRPVVAEIPPSIGVKGGPGTVALIAHGKDPSGEPRLALSRFESRNPGWVRSWCTAGSSLTPDRQEMATEITVPYPEVRHLVPDAKPSGELLSLDSKLLGQITDSATKLAGGPTAALTVYPNGDKPWPVEVDLKDQRDLFRMAAIIMPFVSGGTPSYTRPPWLTSIVAPGAAKLEEKEEREEETATNGAEDWDF